MSVYMFEHYSVLEEEAIQGLVIKPDGTYVDCTVGGGGHAEQIAKHLNAEGLLIGFDQDLHALNAAEKRLAPYQGKVKLIHSNFRKLEEELSNNQIKHVDGILFDLGVSSPQLDRTARGFSYRTDAVLDMRMDQTQSLTAFEIVNHWSYQEMVAIFFKFGEEKFSKQVARKIETYRNTEPIKTTHQLVSIIKEAIPAPARRKGGHPAKRIFQAIRMAVNDELHVLQDAINQSARVLSLNGRLVVITFHSLEDRLCKRSFKKWSTEKEVPKNIPVIPEGHKAPFKLVIRKPIIPSEEELADNRRSKSANLRIVEKIRPWDDDFIYEERWRK